MNRLGITTAYIAMAAMILTSCEKIDNTPLVQSLESDDEVASYYDELLLTSTMRHPKCFSRNFLRKA